MTSNAHAAPACAAARTSSKGSPVRTALLSTTPSPSAVRPVGWIGFPPGGAPRGADTLHAGLFRATEPARQHSWRSTTVNRALRAAVIGVLLLAPVTLSACSAGQVNQT